MHVKAFVARSAQIRDPTEVSLRDNAAPLRAGLKANIQYIAAALRLHLAPPLPIRQNMKFTAEIKAPGRKDPDHHDHEHAAEDEKQS